MAKQILAKREDFPYAFYQLEWLDTLTPEQLDELYGAMIEYGTEQFYDGESRGQKHY